MAIPDKTNKAVCDEGSEWSDREKRPKCRAIVISTACWGVAYTSDALVWADKVLTPDSNRSADDLVRVENRDAASVQYGHGSEGLSRSSLQRA